MRTVLTYGTFDLLHVGHVRILERARRLGDRLVVGISTDAFNKGKGKRSIMPYEHRATIVGALNCVSEVIPEENWGQKSEDIRRLSADVLVMGDDWSGKFDDLRNLCEVVYLPRTEGISTTELKETMRMISSTKITELKRSLLSLQDVVNGLSA